MRIENAMAINLQNISLDRMIAAVEAVRERVLRATSALRQAGIPYAVAGDNAVAAWVAGVDRAAVRNTNDVDILVRRADFEAVKAALASVGFVYRHAAGIDCFLDGPEGKARDAVHLIFANERVRPDYETPSADVTEAVPVVDFDVVSLEGLVRMKLNSFRRKDQVHLLDMLDVGLIDASWLPKLAPGHATRLKELIDNPDD